MRPNRTATGLLSLGLATLAWVSSTNAAPTITLAGGVVNPPPNATSVVPEIAIADKAALIKVADFKGTLQTLLTAAGFTAANKWTLVTTGPTLDANATFNITDYNLHLNGASTKFGELMKFKLDPNLAQPAGLPAGAVASVHWLQYINTDHKPPGANFVLPGLTGNWEFDNGFVAGGAAAGATTGPYYDSNAGPGQTFTTPPTFEDDPQFFSGFGTYLHFTTIPAWDVFVPAAGGNPATESIYVGDYGITWGFGIVPEPGTAALGVLVSLSLVRRIRR